MRKALRNLKKQLRYSGLKQTEVVLLIYFCAVVNELFPKELSNSTQLQNIVQKQKDLALKAMSTLHPDLQYDLRKEYSLVIDN